MFEFHWAWFTLAAALIMIEVVSPTFFFLWPGLAALTVGIVSYVIPDVGFVWRLAAFGVLTFLFAYGWKIYLKHYPNIAGDPALNKRAEQLIGKIAIVTEPIVNGRGRAQIGDSSWVVMGQDCPENTVVVVKGSQSNALLVVAQQ